MTMQRISKRPNIISKRILTGTPNTDSPFELYSQYNLLDRKILDCDSFLTFKHRYAEYEEDRGYNHRTSTSYEILARDDEGKIKYRNLEDLKKRITPFTMWVQREDVSDAPPKIYQQRYYELSKEQQRFYNDLRDKYIAELQSGMEWQARDILTRMLRLQQILSNFMPAREEGIVCNNCDGNGCDECDQIGIKLQITPTQIIDKEENPRLEALREELAEHVPTLIFARFRHEITTITKATTDWGFRSSAFFGDVSQYNRDEAIDNFQHGKLDNLILQTDTGGRGVRLDKAHKIVFYSNTFSLRSRLQAEDRAEDLQKKISTGIIDIVAQNTIDEILVNTHKAKRELFSALNDNRSVWL